MINRFTRITKLLILCLHKTCRFYSIVSNLKVFLSRIWRHRPGISVRAGSRNILWTQTSQETVTRKTPISARAWTINAADANQKSLSFVSHRLNYALGPTTRATTAIAAKWQHSAAIKWEEFWKLWDRASLKFYAVFIIEGGRGRGWGLESVGYRETERGFTR